MLLPNAFVYGRNLVERGMEIFYERFYFFNISIHCHFAHKTTDLSRQVESFLSHNRLVPFKLLPFISLLSDYKTFPMTYP